MLTTQFDYNLPPELIAQNPPKVRGTTRLMVVDRTTSEITHRKYSDLLDYVEAGDVIVLNRTKVLKARLHLINPRNGKPIEVLFLNRINLHESGDAVNEKWFVLLGRAKHVEIGDKLYFNEPNNNGEPQLKIASREVSGEGFVVEILGMSSADLFAKYGNVPLPAYIKREAVDEDEKRYNTVFADRPGSVAAPTASLNLTDELISKIEDNGAKVAYVELEIGWGTFAPVRTESVEEFKIHTERFELSEESAQLVNQGIEEGKKIWSFGTTATRVLESCAEFDDKTDGYRLAAGSGTTEIFIYPGYEWKIVDRLVTNFHAPKTSLIMLVASYAGYDLTMRAYEEAIHEKYMFLSYGDSMLIK